MVKAGTVFTSDESMTLQAAIMLYGSGNGNAFATAHNVSLDDNGIPSLLEGHPLNMEILTKLTRALAKGAEANRSFNGYIPANVLAVGIGSIVWWLPAEERTVSFDTSKEAIGQRSGKTPHPALVFGVNSRGWYVFALKGNSRPTEDTPLYQAPYFNVWESGAICQGTTRIPAGATTAQIEGWNHSFFASNFSHPNVHEANKLVRYKGGPYRFWLDMLEGKFKRFPSRVLVETSYTLKDFISASMIGGEL